MNQIKSIMISGVFALSILAGCANQESTLLLPQQTSQNTGNVSSFSQAGLNSAYKAILKLSFQQMDKNSDKYVSIAEYKTALTPIPAPVESPSPSPSAEPGTPPATTVEAVVAKAQKANIPSDLTTRFSRMDKNKDSKLSFTEASNNSNYFIPMLDKTSLRKQMRDSFNLLNTVKNDSLSKEEFLAMAMGSTDYQMQVQLSTMFYVADKNKDNKLTFSEFEDINYSSMLAYINLPTQPMPSAYPSVMPSDVPATPPVDPVTPQPTDSPAS